AAGGLARREGQGLVMAEPAGLADDGVEGRPRPGRPARAAVDDERIRVLGYRRVEVVHQHTQGGLLLPALAAQLRPAGGANWSRSRQRGGHDAAAAGTRRLSIRSSPNLPSPIAEAEMSTFWSVSQT